MKINRATLSNGLRVVHYRNEKSQIVYINTLYAVGSKNEEFEYTGIAHLFEHLMFEGQRMCLRLMNLWNVQEVRIMHIPTTI